MILVLGAIATDPALQPRETMSSTVIKDYATLYAEGQTLAPIVVFQDGIDYWLADGFHRLEAARKAGLTELPAEVHAGTKRDALFYSCGANKHGKIRTNDDKRRQVRRVLEDEEWSTTMNNSAIARHCGVDEKTVRKFRKELSSENPKIDSTTRQVTRGGTDFLMDTINIGTARKTPSAPQPLDLDPPHDHADSEAEDGPADDLSRADIETMFASPGEAKVPEESPPSRLVIPFRLVSSAPPLPKGQTRPTFNRTNEMVDWAWWTWNPVTGCLHTCEYCYARDIAHRYYPEKFEPTFRPRTAPRAPLHAGARRGGNTDWRPQCVRVLHGRPFWQVGAASLHLTLVTSPRQHQSPQNRQSLHSSW